MNHLHFHCSKIKEKSLESLAYNEELYNSERKYFNIISAYKKAARYRAAAGQSFFYCELPVSEVKLTILAQKKNLTVV